jgi:chorismate dehydratase
MNKIKISAVSYLNSKPFIYGLEHSEIIEEIDLQLDIPSVCADKLILDKVDIGLVPVAVLQKIPAAQIISNYCIGANGEVGSVLLLSEVPLHEIKTIQLDYQSRTSVLLARVLAEKFWKIKPQFVNGEENYEKKIRGDVAGIVIGDRTFALKKNFRYIYDLPGEWKKYTDLPFVFACWVSNKKLPEDFIQRLNNAFVFGLANREKVIQEYKSRNLAEQDLKDYLQNKISFVFDDEKKKALELFFKYSGELFLSGMTEA